MDFNFGHRKKITGKLLKFMRCVSGNTLCSEEMFIRNLTKRIPCLKEVSDVEESDVILTFCPVVSRAGTDIEEALQKLQSLSDSKPAVLMVLYHTFDPQLILPDSSRTVSRENTLTVGCLFYEHTGLLQCQRNQEALDVVTQWLQPQIKTMKKSQTGFSGWFSKGSWAAPTPDTRDTTVKQHPPEPVCTQTNSVLHRVLGKVKEALAITSAPENQRQLKSPQVEDLSKLLSEIEKQLEDTLRDETDVKEMQDKSTQIPELVEEEASVLGSPHLRLVLLGREGSVKSAVLNTILGIKDSEAGASATAQEPKMRQGFVRRKHLLVLDTPDGFLSGFSHEQIRQCICVSTPGPHAFLLVIPVKQSAGKKREMLEKMEKMFGERCWKNTIVLLTVTDEQQKSNIEEFIRSGDQEVQSLVEKCGNRLHCLNIKESGDGPQISELLEKIEKMIGENQERFYSSEIYQQIREMEKRVMDTVLRKRKEDIKVYEENVCTLSKKLPELDSDDISAQQSIKDTINEVRKQSKRMKRKRNEMEDRYRQDIEKMEELYDGEGWIGSERELMKIILPEIHFMLWDLKRQSKRSQTKPPDLNTAETEQRSVDHPDPKGMEDSDRSPFSLESSTESDNKDQGPEQVENSNRSPSGDSSTKSDNKDEGAEQVENSHRSPFSLESSTKSDNKDQGPEQVENSDRSPSGESSTESDNKDQGAEQVENCDCSSSGKSSTKSDIKDQGAEQVENIDHSPFSLESSTKSDNKDQGPEQVENSHRSPSVEFSTKSDNKDHGPEQVENIDCSPSGESSTKSDIKDHGPEQVENIDCSPSGESSTESNNKDQGAETEGVSQVLHVFSLQSQNTPCSRFQLSGVTEVDDDAQ